MAAFRKLIPELTTKYDKSSLEISSTSSDEENGFEESDEDSREELPDKQGLSKVTRKKAEKQNGQTKLKIFFQHQVD